jgi:hypothetical protein
MKSTIAVRISDEDKRRIRKMANQAYGYSRADIIRLIVKRGMDVVERELVLTTKEA